MTAYVFGSSEKTVFSKNIKIKICGPRKGSTAQLQSSFFLFRVIVYAYICTRGREGVNGTYCFEENEKVVVSSLLFHLYCFIFIHGFLKKNLDSAPLANTSARCQRKGALNVEILRLQRELCFLWLTPTLVWLFCFSFFFGVVLRPQRPYGLLGAGAQNVHLDFHTASEAPFEQFKFNIALRSQRP